MYQAKNLLFILAILILVINSSKKAGLKKISFIKYLV